MLLCCVVLCCGEEGRQRQLEVIYPASRRVEPVLGKGVLVSVEEDLQTLVCWSLYYVVLWRREILCCGVEKKRAVVGREGGYLY